MNIIDEIDPQSNRKFKDISTNEWFNNNKFSIDVFEKKYQLSENETPPMAILRICEYAAQAEKKEVKDYWVRRWFYDIVDDWWFPAGSIMQGAGNKEYKMSLMNCTTCKIQEDSLKSIYNARYLVSQMAAYRQGVGIEFSSLRPKEFLIRNSSRKSLGAVHWMKSFDNIGYEVGQRGRIPALLIALNCEHLDIEEFVDVKSTSNDTVRNANISVQITNKFINRAKQNKDMEIGFTSCNETQYKTINPKKIVRKIAENMLKNGEPGIQFIDVAKTKANSEYVGFPIVGSNACSEQMLDDQGVCLLSSINAGRFSDNYKEELKEKSESILRFLDNINTMEIRDNRSASNTQKESVKNLRRVGAGVTNLVEFLFKNKTDYNSEDGALLAESFVETYNKYLYHTSQKLGEEKGSFKAFDKINYIKSPFVKYMMDKFKFKFEHMRNCNCSTIAPSGSISTQFRNCIMSYGAEPSFGLYYWKRSRIEDKWTYYFIVPQAVQDHMKSIGHDLNMESTTLKDNFDGTLGLPIKKFIDKYCNIEVTPMYKVSIENKMNFLKGLYKNIDSSISITNNVPKDTSIDKIEELIYTAYDYGIKSFTCYPEGGRMGIVELIPFKERAEELIRDGIVLTSFDLNKEDFDNIDIFEQRELIQNNSLKRPKVLNSRVHETVVKGQSYYIFIGFYNKTPYEVFLFKKEEGFSIPDSKKFGTITKIKGRFYKYLSDSFEIENITELSTGLEIATTRFVSMGLRHNISIKYIVEQLKKSQEYISDFCSGLARVLRKYSNDGDEENMICPNCNRRTLIKFEGCTTCTGCGYQGACE